MTLHDEDGPAGNNEATLFRTAILYGAMLVLAVALFLIIDAWGRGLRAPVPLHPETRRSVEAGRPPDPLVHVLGALAAVLVTGRLLGRLFRFIRQPPVIGEVVAGILLGPSFLGRIWPEAMAAILPPAVAPFVSVIAQLGVIL
jgi:hypothetical protein